LILICCRPELCHILVFPDGYCVIASYQEAIQVLISRPSNSEKIDVNIDKEEEGRIEYESFLSYRRKKNKEGGGGGGSSEAIDIPLHWPYVSFHGLNKKKRQ
jgi:hypothetical protein